jgi:hypothetical protein
MRAYVVLRTIMPGGTYVTDQPTADRIVGDSDAYGDALTHAKGLRVDGGYALAVAREDLHLYEP